MTCLRLILPTLVLVARTAAATDGALDDSFGNYRPGVSTVAFDSGSATAGSILVQSDGKLVLTGSGDSAGPSTAVIEIARLMPGGALDTTFGTDGRVSYAPPGLDLATAHAAALQADGKIVTVGSGKPSGSADDFLVCRFMPSGALDATFASGGCRTVVFNLGYNFDDGEAVAIQSDGKIVVAGEVGGAVQESGYYFGVARLTTAGALDSTFGFGGTGKQVVTRFADVAEAPTTDFPRAVLVQADGKIVIVGSTGLYNTLNGDFAFARLTSSGTLDPDFGNGGVTKVAFDIGGNLDDGAYAAALQRDGRIVAAGYASYSATDVDYAFVRLDADGNPDSSFGFGGKIHYAFDLGGANADIATSVVLQSDGGIVAAGYSYNGVSSSYDVTMCRLTPAGWPDSTFAAGGLAAIGLDLGGINFERVTSLALQGGRIVAAGYATAAPSGNYDFIALRFVTDLVFTNGFE